MRKHLKILEYTISSLMRRKFKNLGILFVFSFVIAVLASILFLTHSFREEALDVLSGAPELIVQKITGGRFDLIPITYAGEIRKIPGVGTTEPRYWGYYYDPSTGGNYTILGASDQYNIPLKMIAGSFLKKNRTGECVIGKGVADVRVTGPGGTIDFTGTDGRLFSCRVTGIFTAESMLLTNDLVVMNPPDVRRLFGMSRSVATDFVVQVFNPSEIPVIAGKIKKLFPDSRPISRQEILRTYDTLFNWRSGMVLSMFSGALLAFIILAWDKATGLSAEEKREIGILKAIGWETSDILEIKFWEGTVISLFSFMTGIIAAYVHVFLFGATLFSPALKGWSVLFPDFRPMPFIDPYQIFVLLSLTVVPYIAATIIPSWKAAITDPDTVMRG